MQRLTKPLASGFVAPPCSPARSRLTLSSRHFTSNHPRRLLNARFAPRPQLPYLNQSSVYSRAPTVQRHIARLLTTENRRYVREQTVIAVKWTAALVTVTFLLGFAGFTWRREKVERVHASPPDWSYATRMTYRSAWLNLSDSLNSMQGPDWGHIAAYLRMALLRLEAPHIDGQQLKSLEYTGSDDFDAALGIGPKCFDYTATSEAWRAGYVDIVMNLAQLSERLHDYVYDSRQDKFFPRSTMVGPSNPRPRGLGPAETPPNEQDCYTAYPNPAVLYNRIIHGKGFSPKQHIAALHALASWLEFRGDQAGAEQQYERAVAIVQGSDGKTGTPLTLNALTAYTQQASHLVRTGRIQQALPIFLSCLGSIRQSAQHTTDGMATTAPVQAKTGQPTSEGQLSLFSKFFNFRDDTYPMPLHTGDELISTVSSTDLTCQEAELMLYTGEILFSSDASRRPEGLHWTKAAALKTADALRNAKAAREDQALSEKKGTALPESHAQRRTREIHVQDKTAKCKECLLTSLKNWEDMAVLALEKKGHSTDRWSGLWPSWLTGGNRSVLTAEDAQAELKTITSLKETLVDDGVVSTNDLMDF